MRESRCFSRGSRRRSNAGIARRMIGRRRAIHSDLYGERMDHVRYHSRGFRDQDNRKYIFDSNNPRLLAA
jgi:hypothetical protein